jgi:hypothetical protein
VSDDEVKGQFAMQGGVWRMPWVGIGERVRATSHVGRLVATMEKPWNNSGLVLLVPKEKKCSSPESPQSVLFAVRILWEAGRVGLAR